MILVTGAGGFIGKYVIRNLLIKQMKIVVLTRDACKYSRQGNELVIEGTLANISDIVAHLKDLNIKTVIHLAWEGIPDYGFEMSKKNLYYGMNILELCKDLDVSNLVITGSCWEYSDPKGKVSVKDKIGHDKPFQAAKTALHIMAHAFCRENGIKLNWLRLFYVYGPGQKELSLIPHIIRCFKMGEHPQLNGAYNENDFVYVEDVAEAITKTAEMYNCAEVINIGTGQAVRVLDIVEEVAKYFDVKCKKTYGANNPIRFYADEDETYDLLGWSSKIDWREGIRRMLETV